MATARRAVWGAGTGGIRWTGPTVGVPRGEQARVLAKKECSRYPGSFCQTAGTGCPYGQVPMGGAYAGCPGGNINECCTVLKCNRGTGFCAPPGECRGASKSGASGGCPGGSIYDCCY
eukprot:Sspe_Gene.22458::Locus_8548_Transcript_1_1_Confidence_1.000_Length_771::g.22458::m.22458